MGILRADRITGLGGADAITGSCFFDVKSYLKVYENFTLNGDFTIEWWTHRAGGVTNSDWFTIGDAKLDTGLEVYIGSSGSALNVYSNNGSILTANSGTTNLQQEKWHHMALVRSSGTIKIYVNGTADSTTVSNSSIFNGFLHLGGEFYNGSLTVRSKMHMSNFRIVRKTALYTSNFTPPNRRLEVIPETAILCCQSSSDVTEEATGKKIYAERADGNSTSSNVQASRFTPNSPVGFSTTSDVGSQYGSTFDGFSNFATSTYMVPPGGNTRERNRGRAVFGGGESPSADNVMEYINIQSSGRTVDFGDHTSTTPSGDAVSSSTRGIFVNDYSPSSRNTLEFITIATTGNSVDFGDQAFAIQQEGAASNSTRGLFAGGAFSNQAFDVTEFITIATLGNGTDFGDLIAAVTSNTGVADATRALFAGGIGPASPFPTVNRIEYFTIASAGNATDFGDLTFSARYPGSTGDSTRGVFMGGSTPSGINTICFVTIQTTGDATDFGDLVTASYDIAATSNNTRGIMGAGVASAITNTIEQLTIQTTGNATDFGDLSRKVNQIGVCSDSHGGL